MSNIIWRFLERIGAQLVTFTVSIILARILTPAEYGEIAILTVIIAILNIFVDGGFANALIQKKHPDNIDYSTVFYFNILLCVVMYTAVYFCAPLVGKFYSNEHLTPLLRVLAITIIISGIKNVQQAYVSKNFLFKKFFYSTLGGTIVSAVLGIIMALNGFGTWSLVAQHLSNLLIDTLILWVTVKWRPIKAFSFSRLKLLFSYGYKLLLSSLLNSFSDSFRQLIIGRVYNSSDLAFYNKGKQFPTLVMSNINTAIDSVLFPTMAEKQGEFNEVKKMINKSINVSTYILWPLLFGLFAVSDKLVSIVLTDKWIGSVAFLKIFCLSYLLLPIQTANLNALKSVGKSGSFLKLEIEQTITGILLLIVVINRGTYSIAFMYLVSTIVNTVLICKESEKVFQYTLVSQLKDLLPNFMISFTMLLAVFFVDRTSHDLWMIIVEILLGMLIYIIESYIMKNSNFIYVSNLVTSIIKKI